MTGELHDGGRRVGRYPSSGQAKRKKKKDGCPPGEPMQGLFRDTEKKREERTERPSQGEKKGKRVGGLTSR